MHFMPLTGFARVQITPSFHFITVLPLEPLERVPPSFMPFLNVTVMLQPLNLPFAAHAGPLGFLITSLPLAVELKVTGLCEPPPLPGAVRSHHLPSPMNAPALALALALAAAFLSRPANASAALLPMMRASVFSSKCPVLSTLAFLPAPVLPITVFSPMVRRLGFSHFFLMSPFLRRSLCFTVSSIFFFVTLTLRLLGFSPRRRRPNPAPMRRRRRPRKRWPPWLTLASLLMTPFPYHLDFPTTPDAPYEPDSGAVLPSMAHLAAEPVARSSGSSSAHFFCMDSFAWIRCCRAFSAAWFILLIFFWLAAKAFLL